MTETEYGSCGTCGASDEFLIPVWEDISDYYKTVAPDYIGCTECHTMNPVGETND